MNVLHGTRLSSSIFRAIICFFYGVCSQLQDGFKVMFVRHNMSNYNNNMGLMATDVIKANVEHKSNAWYGMRDSFQW